MPAVSACRQLSTTCSVAAVANGTAGYRVVEPEDWVHNPYDGLVAAIRAGDADKVEWLLATGTDEAADPMTHPLPANPPLIEAIIAGQQHIIELLLQHDAPKRLAATDVACGATALHWAAVLGDSSAVGRLLAEGADPQASTWTGCTAVHCGAIGGHAAALRTLLTAGAAVDAVTSAAATALHLAAANGHAETVSVLLDHGADVTAVDGDGRSALTHAAIGGHHSVMLRLLQADRADLSTADAAHGRTCLHWACHNGHLDTANLLLLGTVAAIDAKDAQGDTPLHLAARRAHAGVTEALLSRGAKCEARNVRGLTPLHLAAFFGNAAAVKVLLGRADVAAQCEGRTPLSWATYNGHEEVAQLLSDAEGGASLFAVGAVPIAAKDRNNVVQE